MNEIFFKFILSDFFSSKCAEAYCAVHDSMTEGESVQEPICQNSEGTIIKVTIFPNQGDILLDFLVCLHIKIYSLLKKAYPKFLKFCQALKHAHTEVVPGSKHFAKIPKNNHLDVWRILYKTTMFNVQSMLQYFGWMWADISN